MIGASELSNLLATLEPELSASEVVFCHFPGVSFEDKPPFRSLGAFDEREGLTLIVSRSEAEMHGLPFETVLRAITLNVRSRLEAVGLTAAVAGRLAQHGISANFVAAYYHDHVFVPAADAARALEILRTLQAEASTGRPAAGATRSGERADGTSIDEFVPAPIKPIVGSADLDRLDIRVGMIETVELVAGSGKLVKLTVEFGDRRRSVLAGLRNERVDPKAELEGRQALFVVNLAPRTMAGQISEAMLLDIGYADGVIPVLAVPERPIPSGVRAG